VPDKKKKKEKGSTISLHHRLKVFDKNGKLKHDTGVKKSHSFVEQFLISLMHLMSDATIITNIFTDVNGITRSGASKSNWVTSNYPFSMDGAINNANYGIVIGTGNTAVTISDIDLDTQIAQGTGSGQMSHAAQNHIAVAENGAYLELKWSRTFSNSSGATITVAEIGSKIFLNASYYVLMCRDVLGATVPVGDGDNLVVEYIWRTQV
jgi:hypothetical protein